jgi:hypothetical protein
MRSQKESNCWQMANQIGPDVALVSARGPPCRRQYKVSDACKFIHIQAWVSIDRRGWLIIEYDMI